MSTKQKAARSREAPRAVAVIPPDAALKDRCAAWASHHGENGQPREAPASPVWRRGGLRAKDGVGTALCPAATSTSLVWFTLGQGILTEIFYPRVDLACTRDLGLIVTDGKEFFSEERVDAEHRVEHPVEGVPLYRLVNTCRQGRYRIEKTIFAHPHQDAVLQITCFTPLKGKLDDYHLYALLAPHLGNRGAGNSAWLGTHRGFSMLFARRGGQAWPWPARPPGSRARSGMWGCPMAGRTCRSTNS